MKIDIKIKDMPQIMFRNIDILGCFSYNGDIYIKIDNVGFARNAIRILDDGTIDSHYSFDKDKLVTPLESILNVFKEGSWGSQDEL